MSAWGTPPPRRRVHPSVATATSHGRAARDIEKSQAETARRQQELETARFDARREDWDRMFRSQQEQRGGFADLMNSYNTAFAQAKAQNEQKYQQQLGLVDQTTGQQRDDVISQYQKQSANTMQRLARTGLGNTTVGATLQQGNVRERTSALNRLSDQMTQQKLGVMQGFNYQAPDAGVVQSGIQALAPQFNYPTF